MKTITHIRLSDKNANTTERIIAVWLGYPENREESVPDVIRHLHFDNEEYYYTNSPSNKRDEITYVIPQNGDPYIKTKGNETTEDNLLSLPHF